MIWCGSLEGTVAVAQEHVQVVAASIRHIELPVGIEVTHGHGGCAVSKTHGLLESAVAVAQQNGCGTLISHRKIGLGVAVKVTHGDGDGTGSGTRDVEKLRVGRGKAAVTVAQ